MFTMPCVQQVKTARPRNCWCCARSDTCLGTDEDEYYVLLKDTGEWIYGSQFTLIPAPAPAPIPIRCLSSTLCFLRLH